MRIRPATTEDVAAIRRVARAAYREAYPPVLGSETVEKLLAEWYSPEGVAESLDHPESETFVAVDDGNVVGFASAGSPVLDDGPDGDEDQVEGFLGSLYVHPDRWGEGIGGALFERSASVLAANGVDRMTIHVFSDNEVGIGFYADRARETGEETHEVAGNPVDVTVFAVDLR